MRPYLVSQVVDSQGTVVSETQPTVVRRVISEETSDYIRNELRYVVSNRPGAGELSGTGHLSYIAGYDVAGKTGTAQQGDRDGGEVTLTFVSFFPAENPQYLALMTIDRTESQGGSAGTMVAPLMREFYLELIRLRNIQPGGESDVVPEVYGTPMPDFSGQRLSEAVRTVINIGARSYQVVGGGTIISHTWPTPGHTMPETSPIIFYTDPDSRISERMVSVPDVVGLTDETAHFLLGEVGLPTTSISEQSSGSNDNDFRPHTSNPQPAGESGLPKPAANVILQQFPTAGTELEQGTHVIVKVR